MTYKPTLYVITGPTASGKSALAVRMALRLGTEVINADSRQVYTGIPVVTAMPSDEERAAVRHHLLDFLPLTEYYSAARFEEDALRVARDLMFRNGSAVVCGGSMMYVDALCHGIDELPTVPDQIRSGLMQERAEKGDEWLLGELERLDPEYYGVVDRRNMKRVFHAVEIIRASGRTYTSQRTGVRREREFRVEKMMIDLPRPVLFDRINRRVDMMVEAGLEEEARPRVSHAASELAEHRWAEGDVRLVRRPDGPPHGHRAHQEEHPRLRQKATDLVGPRPRDQTSPV